MSSTPAARSVSITSITRAVRRVLVGLDEHDAFLLAFHDVLDAAAHVGLGDADPVDPEPPLGVTPTTVWSCVSGLSAL